MKRFAGRPSEAADLIRSELFGIERLEKHAESLAEAQPVTANPRGRPAVGSGSQAVVFLDREEFNVLEQTSDKALLINAPLDEPARSRPRTLLRRSLV